MPPTMMPEPGDTPTGRKTRRRRREVDPAVGESALVDLLQLLAANRRRADDELRYAARQAGDAGVTWERIGDSIGMTRSGAWQYAHPEQSDTQQAG